MKKRNESNLNLEKNFWRYILLAFVLGLIIGFAISSVVRLTGKAPADDIGDIGDKEEGDGGEDDEEPAGEGLTTIGDDEPDDEESADDGYDSDNGDEEETDDFIPPESARASKSEPITEGESKSVTQGELSPKSEEETEGPLSDMFSFVKGIFSNKGKKESVEPLEVPKEEGEDNEEPAEEEQDEGLLAQMKNTVSKVFSFVKGFFSFDEESVAKVSPTASPATPEVGEGGSVDCEDERNECLDESENEEEWCKNGCVTGDCVYRCRGERIERDTECKNEFVICLHDIDECRRKCGLQKNNDDKECYLVYNNCQNKCHEGDDSRGCFYDCDDDKNDCYAEAENEYDSCIEEEC